MSNFNKYPSFPVDGELYSGWDAIRTKLKSEICQSTKNRYIIVVECYHGVHYNELINGLSQLNPKAFIHSSDAFYPENKIRELTFQM